jgi:glycosyltransferase involved in cell wall biosynthesis
MRRSEDETASALARKEEELGSAIPEREIVARQLDALLEKHAETVIVLEQVQAKYEQCAQEVQEKSSVLSKIQSSHGWKVLSFYYKLRRILFSERILRIARERLTLLRDMRRVSASGLFDKDWYLQRNPDVAQAAVWPLRHYLRRGAFEGRDPNPLFDSDWYLTQYPDLAKSGGNPLVHYLCHGATEGRDPSPSFDTDWYLQRYPDVATAGMNPLSHYLLHGAAEGRIPRSDFDRNHHTPPSDANSSLLTRSSPAVRQSLLPHGEDIRSLTSAPIEKRPKLKLRPIVPSIQPKRSTKNADKKRLICITHVLPYPPRAGNEYRIHRMLEWLESTGFEAFLVVCPLPNHSISSQGLVDACSVYSNVLLCQRDGSVLYHLAEGDVPLRGLAGVKTRDFGALLGEDTGNTLIPQRLLPIVRTFCPDTLVELLLHLDSVLRPDVLLLEYVFMTRALPLMRAESIKIVDTIDVFSTKHHKVLNYGIEDGLALTAEEEASLLASADVVVAIHGEEAEELRRIIPKKPVITAGVDFCLAEPPRAPAASPIILTVASDNALNVKGMKDFLRFAWPLVRREVPDVKLRVIGTVGFQIDVEDSSIEILGLVDDLRTAYAEARVLINPAVAGTGLKIKTIESLCHLRPLVTWPSGVDGVEADVRSLCYIATDWYIFAQHVIYVCKSQSASQALVSRCDEILERFSPDTVYAELKEALADVHARKN